MIGLVRNELKKMLSKKRFFILFAILLSITIFLICLLYPYSKKLFTIDGQISRLNMELEGLNEIAPYSYGVDPSGQRAKQIDLQIKNLNDRIKKLEEQKNPNILWEDKLKSNIEDLRKEKSSYESAKLFTEAEEVNKQILVKQYYLDNNIEYKFESGGSAFSLFYWYFDASERFFLLLILSLMLSDIVSKENSDCTIKVLLTKPISRGKILFSKFLAGFIAANAIALAVQLIAFVLLGIIFGFGDPSTPFALGTRYEVSNPLVFKITGKYLNAILGSSYIIPMWKAMLLWFGLQSLLILALSAFCILISTLFKSNLISTGVGFIYCTLIFSIVRYVSQMPLRNGFVTPSFSTRFLSLLFNSYYNVTKLTDGSLSFDLLNARIDIVFFINIALAWTVLCYMLAHIIFVRRDVLE